MNPSNFSQALFAMGVRLVCAEHGLPMPKRRRCQTCAGDAWFVQAEKVDGALVELYRCPEGHEDLVSKVTGGELF